MNNAARDSLRHVIREHYDTLLASLSRRLGSREMARDALHDAFVRLERARVATEIQRPTSYILRMAANIAANIRRSQSKLLSMGDVASILDIPDLDADIVSAKEKQSELEAVKRALQELPDRQRELLLAAWLDEVPTVDLAARYGIAVRTVQHELKLALEQVRRATAEELCRPMREDGRREVIRYRSRTSRSETGRSE